jgi:hypothetical protein
MKSPYKTDFFRVNDDEPFNYIYVQNDHGLKIHGLVATKFSDDIEEDIGVWHVTWKHD